MNAVTFGMSFVLVCLVVLLYCCYKSNKPLREKAKQEAQEKAKQEAKAQANIAEAIRRAEQREQVFEDLEKALNDPYRFFECRTNLSGKKRWTYPALGQLANTLISMKSKVESITTDERLDQQYKLIRDQRSQIKALQANIEDIKKALQMGTPVEF